MFLILKSGKRVSERILSVGQITAQKFHFHIFLYYITSCWAAMPGTRCARLFMAFFQHQLVEKRVIIVAFVRNVF